jgi:hypothetical protein
MAIPDYLAFQYGATAHFPATQRGKADFIIINISQHPIIYSRAICTAQMDRKLAENDDYLRLCRHVCEERCPIRVHSQINVICKRENFLRAIVKTEDSSEFDADKWSEVLCSGLCRPRLF